MCFEFFEAVSLTQTIPMFSSCCFAYLSFLPWVMFQHLPLPSKTVRVNCNRRSFVDNYSSKVPLHTFILQCHVNILLKAGLEITLA